MGTDELSGKEGKVFEKGEGGGGGSGKDYYLIYRFAIEKPGWTLAEMRPNLFLYHLIDWLNDWLTDWLTD